MNCDAFCFLSFFFQRVSMMGLQWVDGLHFVDTFFKTVGVGMGKNDFSFPLRLSGETTNSIWPSTQTLSYKSIGILVWIVGRVPKH